MNSKKSLVTLCSTVLFLGALTGCATESHSTVQVEKPIESIAAHSLSNIQVPISIGKFANHSSYQNGIFSDGIDRLGSQAQTILTTYLQQAGCYQVLDRTNLNTLAQEAQLSNTSQNIKGARYVLTGDVVEFGRKVTGDTQLFGLLGNGQKQTAYSKVNINVIDVQTSAVVYSVSGAGEYNLSNREVLGFGGTAGYDATLTQKVLSLSIREAVNNLTTAIDNGLWVPAK